MLYTQLPVRLKAPSSSFHTAIIRPLSIRSGSVPNQQRKRHSSYTSSSSSSSSSSSTSTSTPPSSPPPSSRSSRALHSGSKNNSSLTFPAPTPLSSSSSPPTPPSPPPQNAHSTTAATASAPLSCLPLPLLLRNALITTLTSNRALLSPALYLLSTVAYSRSPLLKPSRNPLLRWVLKRTLFAQFCAGENPAEVRRTLHELRGWGIQGVMLGWAREVEKRDEGGENSIDPVVGEGEGVEGVEGVETPRDRREIGEWVGGSLQAVELASARDCVCLKLTGAGSLNLSLLTKGRGELRPSASLAEGLARIVGTARARDVTLVVDAEQAAVQPGIDAWTRDLQSRYNSVDRAFVVATYQAYLKATPGRLSSDLADAGSKGYCLGVKLVRGAYLASDPRDQIWDDKEGTDACYDGLAEGLMKREWGGLLHQQPNSLSSSSSPSPQPPFPNICLILATHNLVSTQKAIALRDQQRREGLPRIAMIYAQLMGMADHVSCAIVAAKRDVATASAAVTVTYTTLTHSPDIGSSPSATTSEADKQHHLQLDPGKPMPAWMTDHPRPYKYLVWGSVDECLRYLVRRAEENRDAVARTMEGRKALWGELRRRAAAFTGLK